MNPGHGLTENEIDLLTEEERAGLLEDEGGDEGGDGNGDDGDDENDDDDQGNSPGGTDDQSQNDDQGRDDDANGNQDDQNQAPTLWSDPAYNPKESTARLETIKDELATLKEAWNDGDINDDEYDAKRDALSDERGDLRAQDRQYQAAQQSQIDAWHSTVQTFMDENPHLSANETRLFSFDKVVKAVTTDPANLNLTDRQQLELAEKVWRAETSFADPSAPPARKEGKKNTQASRLDDLPPTLQNVPASDITMDEDARFAALNRLIESGKGGFEEALSRLSDADQELYLSRN